MRRTLATVCLVAVLTACGGSSRLPTTPNPPPVVPPPPVLVSTSGRIVNALDHGQGIGGATLQSDSLAGTAADGEGHFILQASAASSVPLTVRISGSSIIERTVLFKIPGDPVTVTTMPAAMDLTYFNEMCRSFGGIARWATAPALVVERAVLGYGSGRVSIGETVPEATVERTVNELRQVFPILTAGRFADFASIEYRTTPAGGVSRIPDGAIGLTWQTQLLEKFTHVAYGSREMGTDGLIRGEVALDRDWHVHGLPAGSRRDFFNVVQHELGHAMGFSHTKKSPSFMYEVFLMTISPLDRQAFEIFMQRPNGNRSPDADPSGSSLNLTVPAGRTIIDW